MNPITKSAHFSTYLILTAVAAVAVMLLVPMTFAHGPKGHTEGFTPLQAVKKGTLLYDKLVETGKLDASWETGLESVRVYWRDPRKKEIVVKFSRQTGEPRAVYIFFDAQGTYSGSNHTGK